MKAHEKQDTVVMIRHVQCEWNGLGCFTGWADPQLTGAGRVEAIAARRAPRPEAQVHISETKGL